MSNAIKRKKSSADKSFSARTRWIGHLERLESRQMLAGDVVVDLPLGDRDCGGDGYPAILSPMTVEGTRPLGMATVDVVLNLPPTAGHDTLATGDVTPNVLPLMSAEMIQELSLPTEFESLEIDSAGERGDPAKPMRAETPEVSVARFRELHDEIRSLKKEVAQVEAVIKHLKSHPEEVAQYGFEKLDLATEDEVFPILRAQQEAGLKEVDRLSKQLKAVEASVDPHVKQLQSEIWVYEEDLRQLQEDLELLEDYPEQRADYGYEKLELATEDEVLPIMYERVEGTIKTLRRLRIELKEAEQKVSEMPQDDPSNEDTTNSEPSEMELPSQNELEEIVDAPDDEVLDDDGTMPINDTAPSAPRKAEVLIPQPENLKVGKHAKHRGRFNSDDPWAPVDQTMNKDGTKRWVEEHKDRPKVTITKEGRLIEKRTTKVTLTEYKNGTQREVSVTKIEQELWSKDGKTKIATRITRSTTTRDMDRRKHATRLKTRVTSHVLIWGPGNDGPELKGTQRDSSFTTTTRWKKGVRVTVTEYEGDEPRHGTLTYPDGSKKHFVEEGGQWTPVKEPAKQGTKVKKAPPKTSSNPSGRPSSPKPLPVITFDGPRHPTDHGTRRVNLRLGETNQPENEKEDPYVRFRKASDDVIRLEGELKHERDAGEIKRLKAELKRARAAEETAVDDIRKANPLRYAKVKILPRQNGKPVINDRLGEDYNSDQPLQRQAK